MGVTTKLKVIVNRSGAFIRILPVQEISGMTPEEVDTMVSSIVKKFKTAFTLTHITLQKYTTVSRSYEIIANGKKKFILVPRHGFFQLADSGNIYKSFYVPGVNRRALCSNISVVNQVVKGEPPVIPFVRKGSFRGNQELIHNHIMEHYFNQSNVNMGNAGVILNLDTGQGKSYLAMAIMKTLQRKTLIVCHSFAVANDWIYKNLTNEFTNKIGQYNGKNKTDGDVVVILINSIVTDNDFDITLTEEELRAYNSRYGGSDPPARKMRKNNKFKLKLSAVNYFKRFGLVIYDECHKYCSRVYKETFKIATAEYMLGLSATPEISTFYKIAQWGIGPILEADKIPGYSSIDVKFTGVVKRIKYYGPEDFTQIKINQKTELPCFTSCVSGIVEDPYRMSMVAKIVYELSMEYYNIFIMGDRREYAKQIQSVVRTIQEEHHVTLRNELCVLTENNARMITDYLSSNFSMAIMGGSAESDMTLAENKANIIFTTYQYMDTGKSIPKMTAIVLATPRKRNIKQAIGRILRLGSDTSIVRSIVDIVDMKTIAKNQWNTRKQFYLEKEYKIIDIDVKYSDMKLYTAVPANNIQSSLDFIEELLNSM